MKTGTGVIYTLLDELAEKERFNFKNGYTPANGAVSLSPAHTEFPGAIHPQDLEEGEFVELYEQDSAGDNYSRICRKEGDFLVVVAESGSSYPGKNIWYVGLM